MLEEPRDLFREEDFSHLARKMLFSWSLKRSSSTQEHAIHLSVQQSLDVRGLQTARTAYGTLN